MKLLNREILFVIVMLMFFYIPISYFTGIAEGKIMQKNIKEQFCCKYKFGPDFHHLTGYPKNYLFNNLRPYKSSK